MIGEDLTSFRRVSEADVYKAGRLAARFRRMEDGSVLFDYLADYNDAPVASTLPLGRDALRIPNGGLPAFFEGLLPEGHRLTVLRRAVKTSPDDELSLLLAVGQDVPGDVQVLPRGENPTPPKALADGSPSEMDFRALMGIPDRYGLAGVQEKASASMLTAPVSTAALEGILKIDPKDYPHLTRNEHEHLRAAVRLGIPVSAHRLVEDREGVSGLLITRFDRYIGSGGKGGRLALEDGAQALDIGPAAKYRVTGEDVAWALSLLTDSPLLTRRNVYLQFLFAWLTGNGDLHAKNLSVLQGQDGRWSMAPIYDVPCTLVYGDNSLALAVDGKTKNLRLWHWEAFAESLKITPKAAVSARSVALTAARSVDWDRLPFEGSVRNGALRELRARWREFE